MFSYHVLVAQLSQSFMKHALVSAYVLLEMGRRNDADEKTKWFIWIRSSFTYTLHYVNKVALFEALARMVNIFILFFP